MRRIGWKPASERRGRLVRLSAWALFQASQEARHLTPSGGDFGLCLNACVLAKALQRRGGAVYPDGEAVLRALSESQIREQIEDYLRRFEEPAQPVDSGVNPQFEEARFEELRAR